MASLEQLEREVRELKTQREIDRRELADLKLFVSQFDPKKVINDASKKFQLKGNTFIAPGTFSKIYDETFEGDSASYTTKTFEERDSLVVVITIPDDGFTWGSGGGSNKRPAIRLNDDSGSNYNLGGHEESKDSGFSSTTEWMLKDSGSVEAIWYGFLNIHNPKNDIKLMIGEAMYLSSGGPVHYQVSGGWNNTYEQINKITLFSEGSGELTDGTRIRVYAEQ